MPAQFRPDDEEPTYYSDGPHAATAKAFSKIIVPALASVHGVLNERGFNGGLFSTSKSEDYVKRTAALSVNLEAGPAATLTFKHDVLKGSFEVSATVHGPQKVKLTGNTKLTVESAHTSKTYHIPEAELTKPILKKAVSAFVDMVMEEHKVTAPPNR